MLLDPSRSFDRYEKAVIWEENKKDHGGTPKCEMCGKKVGWDEFEADHIQPYSKGGKTTIENGQVLCSTCNKKKYNKRKKKRS